MSSNPPNRPTIWGTDTLLSCPGTGSSVTPGSSALPKTARTALTKSSRRRSGTLPPASPSPRSTTCPVTGSTVAPVIDARSPTKPAAWSRRTPPRATRLPTLSAILRIELLARSRAKPRTCEFRYREAARLAVRTSWDREAKRPALLRARSAARSAPRRFSDPLSSDPPSESPAMNRDEVAPIAKRDAPRTNAPALKNGTYAVAAPETQPAATSRPDPPVRKLAPPPIAHPIAPGAHAKSPPGSTRVNGFAPT